MRLRFLLPALAALLFLADAAPAQCPGGVCTTSGPVRRAWHARPGILFPHPAAPAAPAVVAPAPKVATAAPAVVGAPGDRLKARLLSEIRQLHDLEAAGRLTPEQWDRLLALIELFVRLFVRQPA